MNSRVQKIVLTIVIVLLIGAVAWAASYPTTVWTVPTRNNGDIIGAAFFNDPNNEVIAVETGLLNGFQHNLKPLTTNANDLGTSLLLWRSAYLSQTLNVTQGTITSSTPSLNLTTTWNNSAVAFTGILENVTNTASTAGSRLIDLQVGGISQFNVTPFGGTFGTSLQVLDAGATTQVLETLKAVASQTGDFLDLQNSLGNNIFQFTSTASMVDGLQFNPANTGNPATVSVSAVGTDANINLNLVSKGTGTVQVNGVAAVPTITIKKGSGLGAYVTPPLSYVDVDAANLAFTVTVSTGQKAIVTVTGNVIPANTTGFITVALADGVTTLAETQIGFASGFFPFTLTTVFVGDGLSHTFKLRWRSSDAATHNMLNSSAILTPMMTFWIGAAN
jgi:hypothetical protein